VYNVFRMECKVPIKYSPITASMERVLTDIAPLRPTAGDRLSASEFRERYFPQTASDPPRVRMLNLEGTLFEAGALQELVLPILQGIRAGIYGNLALGVISSDPPIVDLLAAMAEKHRVPLFLANSVKQAFSAPEPVGDLTPADKETFDLVCKLGGAVTSAEVSRVSGMEPAATTNRLANVAKKGYVFRITRSRREGDVFQAPCFRLGEEASATPAAAPAEKIEFYVPPELQDSVEALAEKQGTSPQELLAAAWHVYLTEHREELKEEFARAGKVIRAGDVHAIADYISSDTDERAKKAARRARSRGRKR
jgi:hypothetical protein